jgi:hypothetical protein
MWKEAVMDRSDRLSRDYLGETDNNKIRSETSWLELELRPFRIGSSRSVHFTVGQDHGTALNDRCNTRLLALAFRTHIIVLETASQPQFLIKWINAKLCCCPAAISDAGNISNETDCMYL